MTSHSTLADLGWTNLLLGQLSLAELETRLPARVAEVHRDRLVALSTKGPLSLTLPPSLSSGSVAVGDWLICDEGRRMVDRLLDRTTCLARRAAGETARQQLIAANVDTAFLTTSCNADFNIARIERYLALIFSGGIEPVIVLTKADLDDPAPYLDRLRPVARDVPALAVDALAPDLSERLAPWCGRGRTLCFLGSSGVGKSTLAAALTGRALVTAAIREDDAKGRHTTTARALMPALGGSWLIDTPGMRELRLSDVAEGIEATFSDLAELARQCRFSNCRHEAEPGCAVRAAIEEGTIDSARLKRWQKLEREDRWNSASVADLRAKSRQFGRMTRDITKKKRGRWEET
ncbi:ribosome small subunit-dependent GTPase A [Frigidibacter sp. RF13]|uniref:ribosome small subunit-dependent GTPase A n=1 Tax=Frigidibacter sp. RF13 TaxID=2997340 RepID=UPI002271D8EA|nr:ribosome small subunit-dependent GTPase A [Frigidibacter sp. RF13]MCY1128327.1 ribosome small subunit-dependent GTPase A [Frigidibacter sp. RF13]